MKKKFLIPIMVLILVIGAIGGTLAWLTAHTDEVVNAFTVGNVNVALNETTSDYKMVPGNSIKKDPTVTVTVGSEDSWVFVQVTKSANLDQYISYTIDNGWTALDEQQHPGVYYREYKAAKNIISDLPGYDCCKCCATHGECFCCGDGKCC